MLVAITVSLHFQKLSTAHCFTLYTSLSSWPKLNQNISEPSWLSLCSPLQQATDSISAPSRLMGRQAERGANALITACHMMGLAWVLSNKALMSSFNCLHGIPCQALPELLTHTQILQHRVVTHICPIWNGVQVIQNLYSSLEYKKRPLLLSFQCIGVTEKMGLKTTLTSVHSLTQYILNWNQ